MRERESERERKREKRERERESERERKRKRERERESEREETWRVRGSTQKTGDKWIHWGERSACGETETLRFGVSRGQSLVLGLLG